MRRLWILILYLTVSHTAMAQPQWQWANVGNNTYESAVMDVVTDDMGNVYIAGHFPDTLQLEATLLYKAGHYDIFIAKYSAAGNLIWAKSIGGKGEDKVGATIAVDKKGHIYVSGSFSDTIYIENDTLISKGETDVFLAKYDNVGNVIWANSWGSVYRDYNWKIATDKKGYIYITGVFGDYGGSPPKYEDIVFDSFTLHSGGNGDIYIVKLDSNGYTKWADKEGSVKFDAPGSIIVDDTGSVYVSGNTYNLFVKKYDSSGSAKWKKSILGSSTLWGGVLGLDKTNNVYITGFSFDFNPSIDFLTGFTLNDDNAFFAKYSSAGNLVFAKNIGHDNQATIAGVEMDKDGYIYISGKFKGKGFFGEDTVNSNGSDDIYVNKYDSNGKHIWTKTAGGQGADGANDMTFDNMGNIIVGGYIGSVPANFGVHQISSVGNVDAFVAKLSGVTSVNSHAVNNVYIKLYPNPTDGIINIETEKNNWQQATIYDGMGRQILQQPLKIDKTIIDLKHLTDGLYFIQLKGEEQTVTKKIILQH